MHEIADNFREIKERVARAAFRAGRNPEEIIIIAVTKNQTIDTIREGIQAGIDIIGENRVQELVDKYEALENQVQWHFIGHLQTNKVKYVIDKVHLIHSLDRLSLAEEIERRGERRKLSVNALVQVNVSGEESKFGMPPQELVPFLERVSDRCKNINIKGLMTIAPYVADPEETRPFFRRLRELAEEVKERNIAGVKMDFLSMGMTNDFEVAVEEGANMLRIGRAIFDTTQEWRKGNG